MGEKLLMVGQAEKKWNDLILPYRLEFERKSDKRYAETWTLEPLEKGFGVTIGNAMRRVLLSSLSGAAVTFIRISGVNLEFSTVPGVVEDVSDILLNLKGISLKLNQEEKRWFKVKASGPCVVTAGMIEGDEVLEIMNPEAVICTLSEGAVFDMDLCVEKGIGYVNSEQFEKSDPRELPLDAWFNPVRNVAFHVEAASVTEGSKEYDKLSLTVETNGTLSPEEAVSQAALILQSKLSLLIKCPEVKDSLMRGTRVRDEEKPDTRSFPLAFYKKITELDLSVRCVNCLSSEGVVYVGDLVKKKESDLMKTPNFGRKSLGDIQNVLASMGLSLGMDYPSWPPEDLGEAGGHP